MPQLASFSVDDLVGLSRQLRHATADADTLVQASQRVTDLLFDSLADADGGPACETVYFYLTHPYGMLPAGLAIEAHRAKPGAVLKPSTRCLTLLATRRSPRAEAVLPDAGPTVRPLLDEASVRKRLPVLTSVLDGTGLELALVIQPPPGRSVELHHADYGVYYVPDINADSLGDSGTTDTLVAACAAAMLAMVGVLPTGDAFLLFVCPTMPLEPRVVDLFRSLVPAVKAAVVPFTFRVFD